VENEELKYIENQEKPDELKSQENPESLENIK
jgi:hypothetical protein